MVSGFVFTFITGLIWTVVGIVYGRASEKCKSFCAFFALYSLFFQLLAFIFYRPGAAPLREVLLVGVPMFFSGTFGTIAFLLMTKAMRCGPHDIAWTFSQSAMWVPFAAGLMFMNRSANWINIVAMAVILISLAVLGKQRNDGNYQNKKLFLCYSVLSMFLMGIGQTLTMLPNEFNVTPEAMDWRLVCGFLPGLCYFIPAFIRKENFGWETMKYSLSYAIIAFAGQATLYIAMDKLAVFGKNHLIYPIALSCCILFFALFCRFFRKEKLSAAGIAAMVMLIAGIFALL